MIAKAFDAAGVNEPDVADNVLPDPARSTLNPENDATPATAFTVAVPLNVPVPEPIATVTDAVDDVTVLPYVSCTVTTATGEILTDLVRVLVAERPPLPTPMPFPPVPFPPRP